MTRKNTIEHESKFLVGGILFGVDSGNRSRHDQFMKARNRGGRWKKTKIGRRGSAGPALDQGNVATL
jgi:hypothetical protein